ncbi:MAG: rRNA maturation RNase YbeY [Pirellulales bacterium]
MFEIEFSVEHEGPFDLERLRAAIEGVLRDEQVVSGAISVALVGDEAIHELNRRFLSHDEPTDVLSFVLERTGGYLEGQIVVSTETAAAVAARLGWSPADELLLYVVHGALHLVGYDDLDPDSRARMRQRERQCLARVGLEPRWEKPLDEEAG